MSYQPSVHKASAAILLSIGLMGLADSSFAAFTFQFFVDPPLTVSSLKDAPIPPVPGMVKYVRDKNAAIVLGKALFWDKRVGSDGMACASCHFHAGADGRRKNTLSPGLNAGDTLFDRTASGSHGPNYTLRPKDFPFHQLSDPLDRNSAVLFDTNDVSSSPGTFGGSFVDVIPRARDVCGARQPDNFNVGGIRVRHVEPRNTPTVINAVFNFRNFWDGRANNHFNGVNPFGPRDTTARILEMQPDGSVVPVRVNLANSSLASQSVGPPLSNFEMSCLSRTFKDIGTKLLPARPLAAQQVAPDDSVFGPAGLVGGKGLNTTYATLVKQAFRAKYWASPQTFDGYSQMEANFSLFWGLALQLYESTLVSDQAPIDRYLGDKNTPPDPAALTPQEIHGFQVFQGKGLCITCHNGPTMAGGAAPVFQPLTVESTLVEQMAMSVGGGTALYDHGFYNIGVRPAAEDRGVGGKDPFGHPLSFTREYLDMLRGLPMPDMFPAAFQGNPCLVCLSPPDPGTARVAVDGAFKTPTLRNVALTAPYFHNGGQLTLEQVVDFYDRGGDRRGPDGNDTTGLIAPDAPNGSTSNLAPNIGDGSLPLFLSATEKADLVAFLRYGLTDPRVACEMAPFDHPELPVPDGHVGDEFAVVDRNQDLLADDNFRVLPAIGAGGLPAAGRPCFTR